MKVLDISKLKVGTSEIYNDAWLKKSISVSMLRLDEISLLTPGNKIFKLYYFLKKAILSGKKIITFGGAYSNHLAATAAICNRYQIQNIGIVRGEEPAVLSHTLKCCLQQGMQLVFLSRKEYDQKEEKRFLKNLELQFGDHILIPEGGFSKEGVEGASKIFSHIRGKNYTHICCPVGTATTFAGLIHSAEPSQFVVGLSVLKDLHINERLLFLNGNLSYKNYELVDDYHFGGYAKKNKVLVNFINAFYKNHLIPLDFVYTGKMMYGVTDLIMRGYFAPGSKIICIHTGGLQGNDSLPAGVLNL